MEDSRIKIKKGQNGEIAVILPYNPAYIKKNKELRRHRWNPEERCWMLPNSDNVVKNLRDIFKGEAIWVEPSLKKIGKTFRLAKESLFVEDIVDEDLRKEMVSRKYSPKTIKDYIYYNRYFLVPKGSFRKFDNKEPESITERDIKDYLFHLVEEKQVATSTLNSAINALKFYYGTILKRRFILEIKRPKKDKKLPVVLSKEEVSEILSAVSNIKHMEVSS